MDASDLLLDQWPRHVKEIFPALHAYQQNTLAFCVQEIIEAGTAVMQRVAETAWDTLSSETKMTSVERRLQRFVANERIAVDACWDVFLQHTLPFWQNKPVTLILDMAPYATSATVIYLGILVRGRVLPLAWQVMPQQETWEHGQWELLGQLFERLAPFFFRDCCTVLADRGLSCLGLIRLCKRVGWHYVLRIKQEEWCRRAFRHLYRDWQQGKEVVRKPGERWYGRVLLWKEHNEELWLSAHWEEGYEEAWIVISDQKAGIKRVRTYAGRMGVEATFQDQKSRGYKIECSRFLNRDHLHRWLCAVHLAM